MNKHARIGLWLGAIVLGAAPASAAPVINEIMFRPGPGYPENTTLEFIEIHNPDAAAVDVSGWAITTGADFTFPAGTTIPAGGYLVVSPNPAALQTAAGASGVLGPWKSGATLANNGETITLARPDGDEWIVVDEVDYASEGDWATRTRDSLGGWSWVTAADGGGKSLERRNPRLAATNGQNWGPSTASGGSPGAVNSLRSDDIAPVITGVTHAPAVPTSADSVTISCQLTDESAASALAATVYWRNATTTSPGAFQAVAMTGDGTGRFTAQLAALANKQIVEFYVSATDGANTRTWPAPTSESQNANCTYQVDNEAVAGSDAVYRLVLTAAENSAFQTVNTQSDRQFNVTLVVTRGADTTIRYLTSMRIRGNSSRGYTIKPLRISLPNDRRWDGVSDFIINPRGAPVQLLAHRIQRAAGLVAADATPIEVRRQGVEYTVSTGSTADHGKLVRVEQLNGDYLDNHFPEAVDAQLYRKLTVTNWSYTATAPANPDTNWSGWSKESSSAANDWSDVMNFSKVWQDTMAPYFTGASSGNVAAGTWNGTPLSDTDYAKLAQVADLDYLARWLAVMTIMPNVEENLSTGEDDDYAAAFVNDGSRTRFYPVPHDMDTTFGLGEVTTTATAKGLYDITEIGARTGNFADREFEPMLPLLGTSSQPGNAVFRARYLAAIRELFGTVFDADTAAGATPAFHRFVDNHLAWTPASYRTQIKTFMTARQAHLLGLIGAGKTTPEAATAHATKSADATPALRLNEVLAVNTATVANGSAHPDYIELHNAGTTAVDLAGLRLGDATNPTAYTFPAGTTIAPGAYLVVWADSDTSAPGLHAGFSLDAEGDAVQLLGTAASGGAVIDSIEFGFQIADRSVARTGAAPGTWALTVPTPGAANGEGVALGDVAGVRLNEWAGATRIRVDKDFVELHNPLAVPVPLGGVRVTDDRLFRPERYDFRRLSYLGAGAHLVVDTDKLEFGLDGDFDHVFLIGANGTVIDQVDFDSQAEDHSTGRTTDGAATWSDFAVPTPGLANDTALPAAYAALLSGLRVTELMYQPVAASSAGNYEYVELQNIGAATLDLSGVRFTNGIDYTFPAGTTLAPNAYVVVAKSRSAFLSRYPDGAAVLAPDAFTGALDNSGETLALTLPAPWEVHILKFRYESTWQAAASGGGRSLVVRDPVTTAARDWPEAVAWTVSSQVNGNPGGLTATLPAITSASAATGTVNASFSYQITANGSPTSFGATGLPAGLGVAAATGLISGVPLQGGVFNVALSATNGAGTGAGALVLDISSLTKISAGSGVEVLQNVTHPNGNVYDQVLLTGDTVTISADSGQVTRTSFVDLSDDIVQVEFSGAGVVTISLAGASGPAVPVNYNQGVTYMKGHASISFSGADETSNLSVFSVGRANAVNQALFKDAVVYDGLADIAVVSITSPANKFGGLRTANASYYNTSSLTGVYAPNVQFSGPLFLGDLSAYDTAEPVIVVGSVSDSRVTGGDLQQANGKPVTVDGLAQLRFVDGSDSHGNLVPAKTNKAVLERNGVNVTTSVVVNPGG